MKNNEELHEATASVKALLTEIHTLSNQVTVAKKIARRSKRLTRIAVVFSVLAVVSAGLAVWSIYTNCSNNNEARRGSLIVWEVVLSASEDNPNRTPEEIQRAEEFRAFVHELYETRDCRNPLRNYDLPHTPQFSALGVE